MWEKRGSTPGPTMSREERLDKWWASLDEGRRQHARECVGANVPDVAFFEGLRDAGIGLADVGWVAHGTPGTHIPKAVQKFVEEHPAG